MCNIIILISISLLIFGCTKSKNHYEKVQPAKIEKSDDAAIPPKVILTPEAKARLGIELVKYTRNQDGVVSLPLSSLLYDNQGQTWVYIEIKENEYQRSKIQVLSTYKNQISIRPVFSESSLIVSHGAAELFGTESGVGK